MEIQKTNNSSNQIQIAKSGIDLHNALVSNNTGKVKEITRAFCPGGQPDFDKIYSEGTTVGKMCRLMGKAEAAVIIFKMIEYANAMLNVYAPMNKFQMEELTEDFLEEAKGLTIEDLTIFFYGIPRQQWGHINNRFDSAVVWELWDHFFKIRIEHFYQKEIQYKAGEEKAQPKKPGQLSGPMQVGNIIEAKKKWIDNYKKTTK